MGQTFQVHKILRQARRCGFDVLIELAIGPTFRRRLGQIVDFVRRFCLHQERLFRLRSDLQTWQIIDVGWHCGRSLLTRFKHVPKFGGTNVIIE